MAYLRKKSSINNRFKQSFYGIKRLAKVELEIQQKLKKQAKRYNKSYPGEMVHVDTKRLPLLKGQKATDKREYLFVAIDDFWLRRNFGLITLQSSLLTSSIKISPNGEINLVFTRTLRCHSA